MSDPYADLRRTQLEEWRANMLRQHDRHVEQERRKAEDQKPAPQPDTNKEP